MTGEKATILLVDDERFNLNLLKNVLEAEHEIQVASNGEQAIRRASGMPPPDLILLDIQMPGMDGYQVMAQLQADAATRSIPVIFVTALGEMEEETKGLLLGAVDYIIKPISPPIVRARVQTHLALKRSADQQKALNQSLAELNQLKNIFLGMAAHDLRNPLVAIRGLSELLLEEDLEVDAQREFHTTIHQVSQQMLGLLNDLLDVSLIESGQLSLRPLPQDLLALLRERVALLEPVAQAKAIRLLLEAESPLPLLPVDPMRLAQVVDNLVGNAIKFSPPGSTVRIIAQRVGAGGGFAVVDQGPGLSAADRAALFKPFQPLSATPTGGEKSTGMGLYIVKKIVDAHGGEILVDSPPAGGSRFWVQLPGLHPADPVWQTTRT
ncbi:MAG: hybrid sensor histidine kinase/response regulator [Magnetococcus sp. XQGC-1]